MEIPRLCPNREENAQIKAGEAPAGWKSAKARQKDVDARWAKKHEETHYGYKNHILASETHKLIQEYVVTNAAVHESQVFDQLLDDTPRADGTRRPVYADSAYRGKATRGTINETQVS